VRLLCLAHSDLRTNEFLALSCGEIVSAVGCDEVALLLREGGDALLCSYPGNADTPVHMTSIDLDTVRDAEALGGTETCGPIAALTEALDSPPTGLKSAVCTGCPDGDHQSSIRALPLSLADQRVGAVALTWTSPPHLEPGDALRIDEAIRGLAGAVLSRRSRMALRERVKELSCLYQLFEIAEQPGVGLEKVLQRVAESLPEAWQYPDIAHGRICLDDRIYSSAADSPSVAVQRGDIFIENERRGWVEVAYREPRPNLDEGPFLQEERNLIEAIAHQLAIVVERHHAEEERERLREQLRHADRLATIGQLSAGVAHELNEPLGNILGFAQLALKAEGLPAGTQADLQNIVKASLHAREVIKKLMIFARQTPPQVSETDLNEVVRESLFFLSSRCVKEGIELVEELATGLPPLTADPSQLHQILVNLVVNSIQAMPRGGQLTIRTRSVPPRLLLEVTDTGQGISAEQLPRIFLPFFTTKDVDQGTGLGLSVVHGIVTAHGGTIEVDSEPGLGTTFRVYIPAGGPGDVTP